jgi:peptidoglycan/xylan/chitin deacetylase (PgdA/CDA1 family)
MNCNESLIILSPFDSSRFSGQTSRIYKGISKKDISMFLICIASPQRDMIQKTHLHTLLHNKFLRKSPAIKRIDWKKYAMVRNTLKLTYISLIEVGLLLLTSCISPSIDSRVGLAMVPEEKAPHTLSFRSDDYVVYQLQGGETPSSLAEIFLGDRRRSWVIEDANEGIPFDKNQIIIIPLKEKNKAGLTAEGYYTVPILCYHRFAECCTSPFCTPILLFDQQMRYLNENGYRVITMRQLLDFLQYRHAIPKRSVVITLDDGFRSAYDIAFPLLKKHGFTATIFIPTNLIETSKDIITWNQLREMNAEGFEIGSHTLSHCDLTKKKEGENDRAYIKRIKRELIVSKQIIDKKLGQDTGYLAYPFGSYNQKVVGICKRAGYTMAFTVKRGGNPFFADPFALNRDLILKGNMEAFVTRLEIFHKCPLGHCTPPGKMRLRKILLALGEVLVQNSNEALGERLARANLEWGKEYEAAGDLVEALKQYKLGMTANPQDKEIIERRNLVESELRNSAEEYYNTGMKLLNMGKFLRARRQLLIALRLWPEHRKVSKIFTSGKRTTLHR